MKNLHLLAIAFLFLNFSLFSQEKDSSQTQNQFQVHEIKGKEYYIHVVEQGNTLYAISRMYSVPIEVLKTENPRLQTNELTIGDRLLIPLDEVKRKNIEEDRKSTRLNSSHVRTSYAVFCLKKKTDPLSP